MIKICKPETSHSNVDCAVQEVDDFLPDVFVRLIEIVQTDQFAVSHINRILIVRDGARRVKMISRVRYRRVIEDVGVCFRTAGSECGLVGAGHVIEHHVYVNPHAGVVTPANHLRELLRCTRSRVPDVGYRLIAFPPRPVPYNYVFLDRRDLRKLTGVSNHPFAILHED